MSEGKLRLSSRRLPFTARQPSVFGTLPSEDFSGALALNSSRAECYREFRVGTESSCASKKSAYVSNNSSEEASRLL